MNSLVDTADDRRALRRLAGRRRRSTSSSAGICCLVPGVPGPVGATSGCGRSSGRYLEHSRIYRFANGAGPAGPRVLIGSADLMPRNLDRRVEALVPVDEPELQARLDEILEVNLADDTLAWDAATRRPLEPRRRAGRPSTPTCACRRSPARGPAAARLSRRRRRTLAVGSPPVHLGHALAATGASYGRARRPVTSQDTCCSPKEGIPCSRRSRSLWLSLLLAFGLVAAACGDDDDDPAAPTTRSSDGGDCPADVEGDVDRLRLVHRRAHLHRGRREAPRLRPASPPPSTVPAPATASSCSAPARPTSPTPPARSRRRRSAACEDAGIEFIELKIGLRRHLGADQPGQRRRVPELRRPVRAHRPGVRGRRQLERRAGPGHRARLAPRSFPDADLDITAPGAESGTYDSFIEIVFGDISEAQRRSRCHHRGPGRDQPVGLRVAGRRHRDHRRPSRPPTPRWGWVGFAFAEEAGDQVKEIAVAAEAGTDCVEPSAETIADGSTRSAGRSTST